LIAVFLLGVLPLPALAQSQYSSSRKNGAPKKSTTGEATVAHNRNASEMPAVAVTDDPAYVVGAEDVLSVNVWKEVELSVVIPVRPDGKISLPLINDIQAAGHSPMELASEITARLKQFVADPRVTVTVTQINSRRFYILGEINRPGAFPLLPNMTVLQAISTAGGFTQYANTSKIYVLRNENGRQIKFPFNYKNVINGQRVEQNLEMKPGDTLVVP